MSTFRRLNTFLNHLHRFHISNLCHSFSISAMERLPKSPQSILATMVWKNLVIWTNWMEWISYHSGIVNHAPILAHQKVHSFHPENIRTMTWDMCMTRIYAVLYLSNSAAPSTRMVSARAPLILVDIIWLAVVSLMEVYFKTKSFVFQFYRYSSWLL